MAASYFKHRDTIWDLPTDRLTGNLTWDAVSIALLMDIRLQLQNLNRTFACPNFIGIPNKLDQIEKNTARKRSKKTKRAKRGKSKRR